MTTVKCWYSVGVGNSKILFKKEVQWFIKVFNERNRKKLLHNLSLQIMVDPEDFTVPSKQL